MDAYRQELNRLHHELVATLTPKKRRLLTVSALPCTPQQLNIGCSPFRERKRGSKHSAHKFHGHNSPKVSIILLTLYASKLLEIEAAKVGISVVLSKTVSLYVLMEIAHELMG